MRRIWKGQDRRPRCQEFQKHDVINSLQWQQRGRHSTTCLLEMTERGLTECSFRGMTRAETESPGGRMMRKCRQFAENSQQRWLDILSQREIQPHLQRNFKRKVFVYILFYFVFCRKGRVELVYKVRGRKGPVKKEDSGEAPSFTLHQTQFPLYRFRNLKNIQISSAHITQEFSPKWLNNT